VLQVFLLQQAECDHAVRLEACLAGVDLEYAVLLGDELLALHAHVLGAVEVEDMLTHVVMTTLRL